MTHDFRLLMISAMYENGGNTTQRLLDGHPELISYPYESQLGTKHVQDHLSSLYPAKYRWPVFPLHDTPADDYESIIDEECKVRIKTPQSSKFRDRPIQLDDRERKRVFLELMAQRERTRGNLVGAFFQSTAQAWIDRQVSDRERIHVGYSPIVGVDAAKILTDLPHAHVLNIVRHPCSAYADTKKRPVPLSIDHYMTGWNLHQLAALTSTAQFPGRAHLLRYEDLVSDARGALSGVLAKIGVETSETLVRPSWNGEPLAEVYPWGTIRTPSPEANRAAAAELSSSERAEIGTRAGPLLKSLGY